MTTAIKPNKVKVAIATGVVAFALATRPVDAQTACANVPLVGGYTVSAASPGCYISAADSVSGVDDASNNEGSVANSAVLTVANGGVLTIPSGVTGTTKLIVGSITISDGGSITIGSNAEILIGSPIYMSDADGDGYADSTTYSDATASGLRRRSLSKGTTTIDCNASDGTKWQMLSGYGDTDGDGQAGSASGEYCSGASLPAGYGATPGTDCYDSNAYAYLNSTYCLTSERGDGSYDYNCSTTATLCGTTYNKNCTTSSGSTWGCVGSGSTNCGQSGYTYYATKSGGYTCGQTGCLQAGTGTDYGGCSTGATRCSRSSGTSYSSSVTTGVQACQ